ncbi:MAG: mycofactocin system FadH/OYE family oxidoreductase 2 [Actinobacteria bacterium]|nr:mycofactocin system FadH/OYE family oxidoreductase 2 [Actinomycetota bacterium]
MSSQFRYLFSPLKIGSTTVRNRISFSAHLTRFAENWLPTERNAAYLGERAKGGCGLIITEEQSVHPTDRAYDRMIDAFEPAVVPGYRQITWAVHHYGGRVFAQLNHNGQQCDGTRSRLPVIAPSDIPDVLFRETPKIAEAEDLADILEGFYTSSRHVVLGGFDGIEIQASHASLLRQFMSPLSNRRSDVYGGSLENRMRFTYEVIDALREAVGPDYTLGIRLTADEMIPGGLRLEDTQEIASLLEQTGKIDYINLSIGTFYNLYLVEGSMHTPLGYTVPLAAAVRSVVSLPVFATGRINDPVQAEKVLADGHADMIGMVRAQICDPELAIKALEGRLDDIRACIGCNQGCIGRIGSGLTVGCVQNPAVGKENTWGVDTLKPAQRQRRVLVIGGGPAGMEAARMASLRGHRVTLWERSDHLGGQVAIAALATGRSEFAGATRWLQGQIKKLPIDVTLNHEATVDAVLAFNADVVVVATGSRPIDVAVPGADGPGIYSVWQVLQEKPELGERVLVVDYNGHHQSTSVAEGLLDDGHKVTLVTPSLFVGAELGPLQDLYMALQRLMTKGADMVMNIAVMSFDGTTAQGFNVYSNIPWSSPEADSVVLSMGNQVNDELYFTLKGKVHELHRVGDCVAPRKVDMAILEGHALGRTL